MITGKEQFAGFHGGVTGFAKANGVDRTKPHTAY
jgi:hypothetical protein